jgi:peptidoglycan hydrolase CwlO-like protein
MFFHDRHVSVMDALTFLKTDVKELLSRQFYNRDQISFLTGKVDHLMADMAALQAAITSLQTDLPKLIDAYKAALESLATHTGADTSSQIAELDAMDQSIQTALSSASGAASAPQIPQPGTAIPPATPPATSVTGETSSSTSTSSSSNAPSSTGSATA